MTPVDGASDRYVVEVGQCHNHAHLQVYVSILLMYCISLSKQIQEDPNDKLRLSIVAAKDRSWNGSPQ